MCHGAGQLVLNTPPPRRLADTISSGPCSQARLTERPVITALAWHLGPVYINKDQRTLYMMVASGRDLILGLETGRFGFGGYPVGMRQAHAAEADRGDVIGSELALMHG